MNHRRDSKQFTEVDSFNNWTFELEEVEKWGSAIANAIEKIQAQKIKKRFFEMKIQFTKFQAVF